MISKSMTAKEAPHKIRHQRTFWGIAMTFFVLGICFTLVYESKIFSLIKRSMRAGALPAIQSDQADIAAIDSSLDAVEYAIAGRAGQLARRFGR